METMETFVAKPTRLLKGVLAPRMADGRSAVSSFNQLKVRGFIPR